MMCKNGLRIKKFVELADMYQVLLVLPYGMKGDKFPFKLLIEKLEKLTCQKCTRDIKPLNFMTGFSEYKTVHFKIRKCLLKGQKVKF